MPPQAPSPPGGPLLSQQGAGGAGQVGGCAWRGPVPRSRCQPLLTQRCRCQRLHPASRGLSTLAHACTSRGRRAPPAPVPHRDILLVLQGRGVAARLCMAEYVHPLHPCDECLRPITCRDSVWLSAVKLVCKSTAEIQWAGAEGAARFHGGLLGSDTAGAAEGHSVASVAECLPPQEHWDHRKPDTQQPKKANSLKSPLRGPCCAGENCTGAGRVPERSGPGARQVRLCCQLSPGGCGGALGLREAKEAESHATFRARPDGAFGAASPGASDLASRPSHSRSSASQAELRGPALAGHESYVTFCQLEEASAFTCSADCTIRRWDVASGRCVQVYRGHTSIVNRILVADNQLFSSSYDRTARAWTVEQGQVTREFRGHHNCVLTLAYAARRDAPVASPRMEAPVAGGLLVTGSTDGTAKVWQVASGCCHQTLRGHTGAVLCLVLDAPGHTAFTGSTDATVRAWDILSGQQLRVFREHQGSVICLELTDQLLYSGSADRTVKCWLADTGEPVRTFPAHGHSVSAVKYHAGTLFTGSGDACARAFDAQSGVLQRVFRGHALVINCLQVHGQVLYTASHDGALRLWDVRGLLGPPPPARRPAATRSLSRLFSNKVACAASAPLQPA
ncbi:PREDICTED: WD repeat-containing protein 86 [Dipodomys ordii]|uniref:WD repeat-containing protein 86 n=1 Tax=Dipodomys ordii TaxID=10020 RepID=A0A1S3G305_DIPOR|nr:PREDICTED: WD repeat-containing protein 86 [Dipodomys ordii]